VSIQLGSGSVESLPIERMKAIFFLLQPGSQKPVTHGQKIRVLFQDGREMIGFSSDFKTGDPGFFVSPADSRVNTEQVYVLRWSILSLEEQ
jgi:hypothetical protein